MLSTKDPYLLLSLVNTKLRDESPSLLDLCKSYDEEEGVIKDKLDKIGYVYDKEINQFIAK